MTDRILIEYHNATLKKNPKQLNQTHKKKPQTQPYPPLPQILNYVFYMASPAQTKRSFRADFFH